MSPSAPFIRRPVATTLLTLGIALAGMLAFRLLPVAPLPQVDIPTIGVFANLPGASPETMAATVATPLERALGRIAGVTGLVGGLDVEEEHVSVLERREARVALRAVVVVEPRGRAGDVDDV